MTDIAIPVRAPAANSADDTILPFGVAALDLRGRVVRLGGVIDDILTRHDYPAPVSKLLGGSRGEPVSATLVSIILARIRSTMASLLSPAAQSHAKRMWWHS